MSRRSRRWRGRRRDRRGAWLVVVELLFELGQLLPNLLRPSRLHAFTHRPVHEDHAQHIDQAHHRPGEKPHQADRQARAAHARAAQRHTFHAAHATEATEAPHTAHTAEAPHAHAAETARGKKSADEHAAHEHHGKDERHSREHQQPQHQKVHEHFQRPLGDNAHGARQAGDEALAMPDRRNHQRPGEQQHGVSQRHHHDQRPAEEKTEKPANAWNAAEQRQQISRQQNHAKPQAEQNQQPDDVERRLHPAQKRRGETADRLVIRLIDQHQPAGIHAHDDDDRAQQPHQHRYCGAARAHARRRAPADRQPAEHEAARQHGQRAPVVQRLVAAQQHAEVVGGFHGHDVLPGRW